MDMRGSKASHRNKEHHYAWEKKPEVGPLLLRFLIFRGLALIGNPHGRGGSVQGDEYRHKKQDYKGQIRIDQNKQEAIHRA
jgi:hypothetical protein